MGVIGGSDGPTAVFVTTSPGGVILVGCVILAAVALTVYLWKKRKKNQ